MIIKRNIKLVISLALLMHLAFNALAEDSIEYSPYAKRDYPTRAYFGETHMHTAYSLDAYIGGTRLTPDDAYRFAKGESVIVDGKKHSRKRPLDFVAVTDHAEYLGEMYSTLVEGAPGHDQDLLKQLRNLQTLEEKQQWFLEYVVKNNRGTTPQHPSFFAGPETTKSAWQVAIDAAERNNQPGKFTAFVAYEWSGAPNDGQLPAVGNTVDLKTAKYSNSIGAATLMGSWTDRNFNPEQHAFYYARVLEIPTPRWSTYDAVKNNRPLLVDVASTIQELSYMI